MKAKSDEADLEQELLEEQSEAAIPLADQPIFEIFGDKQANMLISSRRDHREENDTVN